MNKQTQVYIKIIGEALIPLVGFFLWGWSLYFILLFYIIDIFVSEFLLHLKTKKIKSYSEKITTKEWLFLGSISGGCLLILLCMIHVSVKLIHPTIDFTTEIWAFLSYEEMGIAQGVILIPLIVFMGYSSYKAEFLLPQLFKSIVSQSLFKSRILDLILAIIFAVIVCVLALFFNFTDVVYLVSIVVLTSVYQYVKAFHPNVLPKF